MCVSVKGHSRLKPSYGEIPVKLDQSATTGRQQVVSHRGVPFSEWPSRSHHWRVLRVINAAWVRLIENGAVEIGNRDAIIRPTVLA
jgi:hypothetical protein